MKTPEQIAGEIEAVNIRHIQEYWRDRDAGIDRTSLPCDVTDDPQVLAVLRRRSMARFEKFGARMAKRKEMFVFNRLMGINEDRSFGMAELVER